MSVSALKKRSIVGAVGLVGGLLVSPLMAPHAHAIIAACRTDPIVFLSNGDVVDLTATIGDDRADIAGISYTLHAPAGTSVTRIVYTSGKLGHKETVSFIADNAPATYDADTFVDTTGTGISVTTTMSVLQTLADDKSHTAASGQDHQHLAMHIDQTPGS